jgi:hypothetical protein
MIIASVNQTFGQTPELLNGEHQMRCYPPTHHLLAADGIELGRCEKQSAVHHSLFDNG